MVNARRLMRRTNNGSAMTEMGPALLILLMFLFFPMLDMMGAAAVYGSTMYLNMMQTREAAVVASTDALSTTGQVQKGVVDSWLKNGIGKFAKTTAYPSTTVKYRDGIKDTNTQITYKVVTVSTKVTCEPFVKMPWFTQVPGMNAPMVFNVTTEAQLENPDNAP